MCHGPCFASDCIVNKGWKIVDGEANYFGACVSDFYKLESIVDWEHSKVTDGTIQENGQK